MNNQKIIDKKKITYLISLVNQKKYNQVINEGLDLLNQYPSSYDLYNILGVTHNLIGKKDEAGLYFSKSYKINPNEINTINNLANFYFESGKYIEAIPLYNEAINLNNRFYQAYMNLGQAYEKIGDFTSALKTYDKAIELNPTDHNLFLLSGICYYNQGNIEFAINQIREAIKLNSNFDKAYFNLAAIELKNNNLSEALININKCLKITPTFQNANFISGIIHKGLGQMKKAIIFLNKELNNLSPEANTYFELSECYYLIGDLNNSAAFLKKAVTKSNKNNIFYDKLGNREKALGNYKKAAEYYVLGKNSGWEEKEIDSLYLSHADNDFLEKKLENYSKEISNSRIIASIFSHNEVVFKKSNTYNFCKKPFDYIYHGSIINQLNQYDNLIDNLILHESSTRSENVIQPLLVEGNQSAGDLFSQDNESFKILKNIIIDEINKYFIRFKEKDCSFITERPKEIKIKGWFVKMQSGGYLKNHIHPDGWLSGSIYLEMPKELNSHEGAIEFNLHNDNYFLNNKVKFPNKAYNLSVGDIILFPSSIFHKTKPFISDHKRLCIAFDLQN